MQTIEFLEDVEPQTLDRTCLKFWQKNVTVLIRFSIAATYGMGLCHRGLLQCKEFNASAEEFSIHDEYDTSKL